MSKEEYIANENAGIITDAIKILPTEFRCFDLATERVELEVEDVRLKELEAKVEHTLHSKAGHAVNTGAEGASSEEMQEFIVLLRSKATEYLKFADLLEKISRDEVGTEVGSTEETGEMTKEDALRKVKRDIEDLARILDPLLQKADELQALHKELWLQLNNRVEQE